MSAAAVAAVDVPHVLLINPDGTSTGPSAGPRSASRRFPSPSPSIVSSASSSFSSYKRPRDNDDDHSDEPDSDSHKHKRVSSQDAVYPANRPSWPFSSTANTARDMSVSQLSHLSSFGSPTPLTSSSSSPHLISPDHTAATFAIAADLQHDWQEATKTHAKAQAAYDCMSVFPLNLHSPSLPSPFSSPTLPPFLLLCRLLTDRISHPSTPCGSRRNDFSLALHPVCVRASATGHSWY
jgi:hypothetical protein